MILSTVVELGRNPNFNLSKPMCDVLNRHKIGWAVGPAGVLAARHPGLQPGLDNRLGPWPAMRNVSG